MIIRELIELIVCDLDVELHKLGQQRVQRKGLFDLKNVHDLSLDRRELDWFLSSI